MAVCRSTLAGVCAGLVLTASAAAAPPREERPREQEQNPAVEAYIYGYPLVTMEMTRRVMTNVAAPEKGHAPMGRFANLRKYPSPSDQTVTAPNADTLYSLAWLDLSREAYVLSIPEAKGNRYFLFPMLDGWTTVFQNPGTRTTGTRAQKYAITGPGWTGKIPEGVTQYKSRRAWCGSSAGPTAPARRRITRRSTPSRTSCPLSR
jgi:hypothetical protein